MKNLNRLPFWYDKIFQYHKLYLFHTFFKKWKYIFYIDCGVNIFDDISPILKCSSPSKLLAHSDAFPTYEWKLHHQFDKTNILYGQLSKRYDLNINYFQTTIMLYDTNIIEDNTFENLLKLTKDFPISITNDQGIIALYFSSINRNFDQIRTQDENTYYYDYLSRNSSNKYIMLKTVY